LLGLKNLRFFRAHFRRHSWNFPLPKKSPTSDS
jgi:hypothetical protein